MTSSPKAVYRTEKCRACNIDVQREVPSSVEES